MLLKYIIPSLSICTLILASPAPLPQPNALAEAEALPIAEAEAFPIAEPEPEPVADPEPDTVLHILEARQSGGPSCPTVGKGCGTNGNHKCSCNNENILVCNVNKWALAAKCNNKRCTGSPNGPHCT